MGKHIFCKKFLPGEQVRFAKIYTDQEFDAIMQRLNGRLPADWVVFHLGQYEHIKNSSRVWEIAKIPVATDAIGRYLQVEEFIFQDADKSEKERIFDKVLTLANRCGYELEGIHAYELEELQSIYRDLLARWHRKFEMNKLQ